MVQIAPELPLNVSLKDIFIYTCTAKLSQEKKISFSCQLSLLFSIVFVPAMSSRHGQLLTTKTTGSPWASSSGLSLSICWSSVTQAEFHESTNQVLKRWVLSREQPRKEEKKQLSGLQVHFTRFLLRETTTNVNPRPVPTDFLSVLITWTPEWARERRSSFRCWQTWSRPRWRSSAVAKSIRANCSRSSLWARWRLICWLLLFHSGTTKDQQFYFLYFCSITFILFYLIFSQFPGRRHHNKCFSIF